MTKNKLIALMCWASLCTGSLTLVACGGSSSSSSAETQATQEQVATPEPATPEPKTPAAAASPVGSWTVAAIIQSGVTITGDLSSMLKDSGKGVITLNEDGTGSLSLWEEESFTWSSTDNKTITISGADDAGDLTFEDGTLFLTAKKDGEEATVVFTSDGTWDQAKAISMDDTKPATSPEQILGKWTLCGMNMAGLSMYGDSESMGQTTNGEETFVTFNADGSVEMAATTGSWTQTADGITLTSTDITGEHTVPVMLLGDMLALDYSGTLGDVTFISVFTKA